MTDDETCCRCDGPCDGSLGDDEGSWCRRCDDDDRWKEIVIFGRELPRVNKMAFRAVVDGIRIHVWRGLAWNVIAGRETYPQIVEVRVSGLPNLRDLEQAWLEYASLEAPGLYADVTSRMTDSLAHHEVER